MDTPVIIVIVVALLLLIVGTAVLLSRRKGTAEAAAQTTPPPGPAPASLGSRKQEMQNRIAEFMERDLFCLVIQPIIDFRADKVCGGEVLSRLNHPERGVIFPDDFLPAVNNQGLHTKFDYYIFQKSCAWMSRTRTQSDKMEFLSCNFNRKTLSEEGVAQELIRIADRYGVPHKELAIEITEQYPQSNDPMFVENLKQLHAAGFRIFLDDYGQGCTSEQELTQYPLDVVKIDRSMLVAAATEEGRAGFLQAVALANRVGALITCEGIETEEQNSFVRETGCHYGQGFLFFKPMDLNQAYEMMEKSSIL